MTPSARAQAAIELLDEIIAAARGAGPAADTLIARYFKTRRYAGSKDRRAVREIVYRAIRRHGEPPASGRAALLGLAEDDEAMLGLFDGSAHGPAPRTAQDQPAMAAIAPDWLLDRFDPLARPPAELAALLQRAPLDMRVNSLRGTRGEALAALPEAAATPLSPWGLRLPEGFPAEDTPAWTSGLVEIQDEGSQLVGLASAVDPGMRVVDLCAGAGGKSLMLAAQMDNRGTVLACDVDRQRLSRLMPRLARAGAEIVTTRLLNPAEERTALAEWEGRADLVLVDAPCSGTGTWRRNPELRWRLTPRRLAELTTLQARLLDLAAELVRPGGHLVYAVCSLLGEEGREQAAALSARSSLKPQDVPIAAGRSAGSGRMFTPFHDATDGFYVARWQRP